MKTHMTSESSRELFMSQIDLTSTVAFYLWCLLAFSNAEPPIHGLQSADSISFTKIPKMCKLNAERRHRANGFIHLSPNYQYTYISGVYQKAMYSIHTTRYRYIYTYVCKSFDQTKTIRWRRQLLQWNQFYDNNFWAETKPSERGLWIEKRIRWYPDSEALPIHIQYKHWFRPGQQLMYRWKFLAFSFFISQSAVCKFCYFVLNVCVVLLLFFVVIVLHKCRSSYTFASMRVCVSVCVWVNICVWSSWDVGSWSWKLDPGAALKGSVIPSHSEWLTKSRAMSPRHRQYFLVAPSPANFHLESSLLAVMRNRIFVCSFNLYTLAERFEVSLFPEFTLRYGGEESAENRLFLSRTSHHFGEEMGEMACKFSKNLSYVIIRHLEICFRQPIEPIESHKI